MTFRILSAGTYSAEPVAKGAIARTPAEEAADFEHVKGARLLDASTKIALVPGARFGVKYVVEGAKRGERYKCRVVWRYPAPGLLTTAGERVLSGDLDATVTVGWVHAHGFHLDQDVERYPEGVYKLEIFIEDDLVLQQSFELFKPPLVESK
ncbi:MAG: DUF3859 domain-containing protein [Burkholderiales bacterium]